MKKIITLIFLVAVISACRKDNSTFVNKKSGASGAKCLAISAEEVGSGVKSVVTYQSDSIIASIVQSDIPDENQYLKQETPKMFLYSKGSEALKDVKYRMYLNSFGAVEKEVAVTLNADNKTFTEVTANTNTYTYNSKKQLVNMNRGLDPDDGSYFELTYDAQNRISKILVYEKQGGELYFTYDNFKFSSQPKKDNLGQIGFDDTIGLYFIPSLRNVYIAHYETTFEGSGLAPDTYDFGLKFNKDGVLEQVEINYVVFGIPIDSITKLTFSCK